MIEPTSERPNITRETIDALRRKSIQYRRDILRFVVDAGAGHTGGSLSCIDILNVLYNGIMDVGPDNFDSPDRDHYIQSKGHSVEALYVVLADRGFVERSELVTGARYQSHFIGHPTRKVRGVEHNTGGPFSSQPNLYRYRVYYTNHTPSQLRIDTDNY